MESPPSGVTDRNAFSRPLALFAEYPSSRMWVYLSSSRIDQNPVLTQLQPTFTPGWINHPGLKVGCVFAASQNPLYSRAVATPGTKGQTFSPDSNHHLGLKNLVKVGCVFAARQNPLYSRVVATPGTKGHTFSPGSNQHPGLKNL